MVKCADCGYLAVRSKVDYSLGEATSDFREKGMVAIGRDDRGMNQHPLHENIPLCFTRQPYFRDATKNIKNRDNPFEEVKAMIQKDIDCKEFTTWQQGFTPKEHREMQSIKEQREWQEKQRKSDRCWRFWEILAFIIAGAVTAFIASLIGRGSLW